MNTATSTPTLAKKQVIEKNIDLATNLNGKLHNEIFCHIAKAGINGIPETRLNDYRFIFRTKDKSHPDTRTKVIDSVRKQLHELSDVVTLLSHAMRASDFIAKVLKEVPDSSLEMPMVVYFYQKVQD